MALKFVTAPVVSGPQAVPPYAPFRTFNNFLASLKQGIPSRIDRSVMASMSGALQSQLTASLRYLGLISPNGQPSRELVQLVNSEGQERQEVLRIIVTKAYQFLFNCFELKTATPRMLEEKFAEAGASGGTIDKCVLFFLAAAKEAGIELSPHMKTNRQRIAKRPRIARTIHASADNSGELEIDDDAPAEMSWAQMLLSKFPSFDPSWPDDVKAKWFDAFDKLMKQGQAME